LLWVKKDCQVFLYLYTKINLLKKSTFLVLVLCSVCSAQDYIDLFKISYIENYNHRYENTAQSTNIESIEADLTIPFQVDEKNTIITGFLYSQNSLSLFPLEELYSPLQSQNTTLYSTTLKIGINRSLNEKWTGALIFLPKFSSDYKDVSVGDFFWGGFSLFKYKKNKRLSYKFGAVVIQQTYGIVAVPIFGLYYKSVDQKLELDLTLPVTADVNYKMNPTTTFGINYYGIGRSYDIHQNNTPDYYIGYASLEFSTYLQYSVFNNSILLRGKFGYATFSGGAYEEGDNIDVRIVGFFDIGGERTRLNPGFSGAPFAKLEAVYRFDFSKKK
jgi:hypothetical protein